MITLVNCGKYIMFKITSINFSVMFLHVKLILISTIIVIVIYILTYIHLYGHKLLHY